MQNTKRTKQASSVYLKSSHRGRVIITTLTDEIQKILEKDGHLWFEALARPITISEAAFETIDQLVSPDPHVEPG